jgi:hypothetical protein
MNKGVSLYSNFNTGDLLKGKNKFSLVLKSTKSIISNSKLFNDYLKNYMSSTQKLTFKKPDIIYYPLLKKNASALIPLNKTQYNSSLDKTTLNKTMKHSSSDCHFFISNNKNDITNKNKKLELTKEKDFPSINNFYENIEKKPKKNIRKKLLRSLSTFNFKNKDKRNNILIEDFLYKWINSDLKYEENDIFNREEVYKKFIEEKINYLKDNKIENITTNLESSFEHFNGDNIILKLNPLKIIFRPINNKDNKYKENIINLPLSFQFLFYYKGIDFFQKILLSSIKFNKDYSQVYLNDDDLYDLIRNNNDNSDNDSITNEKNGTRKISFKNIDNFFHQKLTKRYSKFSKSNKSDSNSEIKKTVIYNNEENNIHNKKKFYNEYNFIWITDFVTYNVKITIPYITFDCEFCNKIIMKYIDQDLFCFIYMNNFLNWDFYIINYLFSFKLFRKFIEYHLSKRIQKDYLFFNFETIKNNGNSIFSLSKSKVLEYNKKDLFYCFFCTKENKNSLYTFHSYSIKVEYDQLNSKKNWVFELNFEQMKFLNQVNQYESLEKFIPKMLIYNFQNGDLRMDFSVFKDFSPKILNYKKKEADIGLYKKDIDYISNSSTPIKMRNKGLNIKIEMPYIEKNHFNNNLKHIKKEVKYFHYDFLQKLDNINLNEWPLFIINHKNEWLVNQKDYLFRINSKDMKNNSRKKSVIENGIILKKNTRNFRKLNSTLIDFKNK